MNIGFIILFVALFVHFVADIFDSKEIDLLSILKLIATIFIFGSCIGMGVVYLLDKLS